MTIFRLRIYAFPSMEGVGTGIVFARKISDKWMGRKTGNAKTAFLRCSSIVIIGVVTGEDRG